MPSAYAATVLRTSKRPIPNAMRLPVGALLLTHELLVGVVVALEPAHAAVALEDEEMRRDAVEEPAVVADHHDAAREVEKRFLQRAQRVDVEIVRRLVEQQHVRARLQHLREMDAVALAAREISDALLLVGPAEIERRDVRARVARPGADLDGLLTLGDLLPDVLLRIERVARLRHVAELHRLAHHQRAAVRLLFTGDEAEQRRLPGSVRTDDPDDATARQREGEVVEQQAIAIALAELVRVDDDVAEPRSRRDADLELALALLGLFRKEALVRLDACFALRLPRARRRLDPLELAREGSLPRRLLLLFVRQPLALLVQPRAVVALVRDASALVELEDPAGGVVEEVAVVRHRDDTAVVAGQRPLQPCDRVRVEMVRGLVEQQQIGVRQQQTAKRDATALAARERFGVLLARRQTERIHRVVDLAVEIPETLRLDLVLRLLEVRVQLVHFVIRKRLAELRRQLFVPLQDRPPVRDAFLDVAPHVLGGVELGLLGEQAGAVALRDARVADVLLVDTRHDAEKRRFAGA